MPRKNKVQPSDSDKIDETDFLVIDFETTGLSPNNGDRVCEVGAVKLRGSAIVDSFSTLINPQRPISAGAYAVNRISPAMVADAPSFAEIADHLWKMMQQCVIVAYNAPFDVSFLKNEFQLSSFPPMTNHVVDALAIARKVLPGLSRYSQESVANVAGIPFPVKHRALEDCMTTAKLFLLFTSIAKAHDLSTVKELNSSDLGNRLQEKRLAIMNHALSQRSNLWIRYLASPEPEIVDRIVTPKEHIIEKKTSSPKNYLFAYCHTSQREQNFRMDRILDIRLIPS